MLHELKQASDVLKLPLERLHKRGHWVTGFGWNHHHWTEAVLPTKEILDTWLPDTPVMLSRVDGHASWLNSKALAELKLRGFDMSSDPIGGRIERDVRGEPTGILFDQAHIKALSMLPDFSDEAHLHFLKSAQSIFNRAGFTHVRDLSMNPFFWNLLRQMEDRRTLTVCLESFVTTESLSDLDRVLVEIKQMQKDHSQQLRLKGVKIFIDGSLGSKTAYLSQNYSGENHSGILIWPYEDIKQLIQRAWGAGQEVAIHTIGDQAVALAVRAAREVAAGGVLGRLHLEHVQVLNHETVQMMKPLHVSCYMQPCHWISDSPWLKQVLPHTLQNHLFQWELLRKNKIPFYFGSDSPIEKPSLFDNHKALRMSAEWGVPELKDDWKRYHQHPDQKWMPSVTEINDQGVLQVNFNGEPLF